MPETPAEREQDRREKIAADKASEATSKAVAKDAASSTAGKGLGALGDAAAGICAREAYAKAGPPATFGQPGPIRPCKKST